MKVPVGKINFKGSLPRSASDVLETNVHPVTNKYLTLPVLLGYFRPKYKDSKIFENHLNPVMLVFIGKLPLSTLR